MSYDPEDLPSLSDVHHPTLEEVLRRFASGTLGEISDPELSTERTAVIFSGPAPPEASDAIYVDEQGGVVYPFARKFERGESWQPGDVVRSSLRVAKDDEGGVFLRTNAGDPRYDDIYKLSEEEQAWTNSHGLANLDLDIEIAGPGEYVASNVFTYPARIRRINSIEEVWDGERPVATGEYVLAQGEVVEYVRPSWQDHREVSGSLALRLASGREVTSVVHESVYLDRGVIDVMEPGMPLAGETVQVHIGQNDGGRSALFGQSNPIETPLQAYREAYLVAPHPDRLADYNRHREAIAAAMSELAGLEGAEFRQTTAALIREHLTTRYVPNTVYVTNLMSAKEQTALLRLASQKFPDADDGMPNPDGMYLSSTNRISLDWFVSVSDTLGVNTLAMSRREYYRFCEDLVTRRISSEPKTYVDVYPLTYLNRDFSVDQRLSLLRKGCETWLPYASDPAVQLAPHEDTVFDWVLGELSRLSQEYPPAGQYYRQAVEPLLDERRRMRYLLG